MRASHVQLVQRGARFPTGHRDGHDGFTRDMAALRASFYAQFLETREPKQPDVNEVIAAFDAVPPAEFSLANLLGHTADVKTSLRSADGADLAGMTDSHGNITGEFGGWPYKPIIDSLSLDVRLFDAGRTPYPLAGKSVDSVLCLDALEHYCHPQDWLKMIAEFTRLARRSVLVITNPVQGHLVQDAPYMAAFHAFQNAMRSYDRDGFQCVHAGIN